MNTNPDMNSTAPTGPRVLVFEDNEMVRFVVEQLLQRRGYDVLSYPSPALCPLHLLHKCQCGVAEFCADAIITDLQMPLQEGLEFLQELAAKSCKVHRIAILSADISQQTLEHARRLGCRVFTKPDGIHDLLGWLDSEMAHLDPDRKLRAWGGAWPEIT